jgi:hypothetical protein
MRRSLTILLADDAMRAWSRYWFELVELPDKAMIDGYGV